MGQVSAVPPTAEYLFKHALVQDTAYSTLLRGPRQALHRRIAEALEQRFPESVETRPEILAHHYGEAAIADKAIAYWHLAGKSEPSRGQSPFSLQSCAWPACGKPASLAGVPSIAKCLSVADIARRLRMGATPVDLYRRGNAGGPRMDHVRPVDVESFSRNGMEWVRGRSGGISTFASPTPPGRGKIWHLPAGTSYSDELHLENDHGDHWSWEPAQDMEMARYRAFLAAVGRRFV